MSWNRQASSSTYAAADDDAWDGDIGDADDDLEYVDDDVGYTASPPAVLNLGQAYPGLSVCIVSLHFTNFHRLQPVCKGVPRTTPLLKR